MLLRRTGNVLANGAATAAVLLCSGCLLQRLNGYEFEGHFTLGLSHLEAHRYHDAEKQFGRAYTYTVLGRLGAYWEAASLYNYGIALGHQAKFRDAEDAMKRALGLDETSAPPEPRLRPKRLFELARLYQAWGKDELARDCYKEAMPLAGQQDVEKIDPIGFAVVLEDYAALLEKMGAPGEARAQLAKAAEIRHSNPGKAALIHIDYYPSAPPEDSTGS